VKKLIVAFCLGILSIFTPALHAQSTSGISNTNCSQVGNTLVCSSTTTLTLPAGTNLTGMTLPQSGVINPPTGAAPLTGCSVSPPIATIVVGNSVNLSANCATGTAPTDFATYQWYRNSVAIVSAISSNYVVSGTSVGSAVYSVQISNAATSSNTASASATVVTNANAITVPNYCPSNPVRAVINGNSIFQRVWTNDIVQSFVAGETFIIQVNIDNASATAGRYLATLNFSDAGSERGGRYVTLSKSKCDFTDNAQWLSPNFLGNKMPVNAGSASIAIGASDTRPSDVKLNSTGVWYLNIQNVAGQCPSSSSCHAVVDWAN
jgi:hypothetical protein